MDEYVFDPKHDRYPVAVHVFLIDATGRILLMRRAGSGFADGRLGLPAGHVDLGETPTAAAIREVGEELGIELDPQQLRPTSTMFRRSLEPRVDLFFATSTWAGVPEIREPHKCTEIVWADPTRLPDDALDFLGQAWADARDGHIFREHRFPRSRGIHTSAVDTSTGTVGRTCDGVHQRWSNGKDSAMASSESSSALPEPPERKDKDWDERRSKHGSWGATR